MGIHFIVCVVLQVWEESHRVLVSWDRVQSQCLLARVCVGLEDRDK